MRPIVAALLVCPLIATAAPPPSYTPPPGITPGQPITIPQNVRVNVVLVGLEAGAGPQQIDDARFRSLLTPFAAVPFFKSVDKQTVAYAALTTSLSYNLVYAPPLFEDALFGTLRSLAIPQTFTYFPPPVPQLPITPEQLVYDFCNVDPAVDPSFGCDFSPFVPRVNHRFITQNHFIPAPVVERVLAAYLPSLGVDPREPTVVLINWFGRPDFIDHIYFKANEPDSDTGYPHGFDPGNFMSGWGGTAFDDPQDCPGGCPLTRILWRDLSADTAARTGAVDLVSPDVRISTGGNDGIPDYRFPPIWEYGFSGYRAFDDLTGDLAEKFISDVVIGNVMFPFTLSPPVLSPPRAPARLQLDANFVDVDITTDYTYLLNAPLVAQKIARFPYQVTTQVTPSTGILDGLARIVDCFGEGCYGNRFPGGFDPVLPPELYFFFRGRIFQFLDGDPDYEVPIFILNMSDARAAQIPFAGAADFNHADRGSDRKTYVYVSSSPARNAVVGFSDTLTHEVGHHLGLHHPHDGQRCLGFCAGVRTILAKNDTFYGWWGDQVSDIMSYLPVNTDFSQFQRDNLNRFLTAGYLNLASEIAAEVIARPDAASVGGLLDQAFALGAAAIGAHQGMDYVTAQARARAAYERVVSAADALHVHLEPSAWQPGQRGPEPRHEARDLFGVNSAVDGSDMRGPLGRRGLPQAGPIAF